MATSKKKVVVKGGGENLYHIGIRGDDHYVRKVHVRLINSYTELGRTKSLSDALSIIRSHSGCEIEKIVDMN